MSIYQHGSGPTSNDLLESLIAKHAHARSNNPNGAACAAYVEITETAPAVEAGMSLQTAE
ncbi:MAG: hypothetical protein ACLP07_16890 [Terracidiphilus sp.]